MSKQQRENLEAILRQSAQAAQSAFPADSDVNDVNEQRRQLRELLSAQPLPADVTVTRPRWAASQPPRSQSAESKRAILFCTSASPPSDRSST